MQRISLEQLLAVSLAEDAVDIPELGGTLLLREMDMATRAIYEKTLRDMGVVMNGAVDGDAWMTTYPALLVAFSIVDDAGCRPAAQSDIVQRLMALPSRLIDKLFVAAERLNAASPAALEAAEKN